MQSGIFYHRDSLYWTEMARGKSAFCTSGLFSLTTSFTSSSESLTRRLEPQNKPQRHKRRSRLPLSLAVANDGDGGTAKSSTVIPGTPCFTRHITASPMPKADRAPYIGAAVDATVAFCNEFCAATASGNATPSNVCNVTMMLPQLNPELDIFDRRFVLELTWALVNGLAFESGLKTRVLVQGVGKYGAVPLSVAGLRRTFEADMMQSMDLWGGEESMASVLRVADLENPRGVAEDDEAVLVITPSNATGMPVVKDVMDMVARVGSTRPIVLINPRLRDIPSAAGVMGVGGRAARGEFLGNMSYPFYLRLLYDTATLFPLRGIMYHEHGSPWQLWRPDGGGDEGGDSDVHALDSFRLIGEFEDMPRGDDITEAMAIDRRSQRLAAGEGQTVGLDTMVAENVPAFLGVLVFAILASGAFILKEHSSGISTL